MAVSSISATHFLSGIACLQILATLASATTTTVLPPLTTLKQQPVGQGLKTRVPASYSLSFDINPKGTLPFWSNILHYTIDNTDNSRLPAIFFQPNSTRLRIDLSTTLGINDIFFAPYLPLNTRTSLRIEAVSRDLYLFYNNSLVALMLTKGDRLSADNATLLVSNPWYPPAYATISAVKMTAITTFSTRPAQNFSGLLSSGIVYEKARVPENYSLSFDINPKGTLPFLSNILHYTIDNTDNSRLPAIFFQPNTTTLIIGFSTTFGSQEIVYNPSSLPLHATTRVRIEAVGRDVYLFYNNSLVALMLTKGDRLSADSATLLVSNPWYKPASATISAVKMTAIIALSSRPARNFSGFLSSGIVYEKARVPENYSLSFEINPNGTLPSWSSILHYTQNNTYSSRLPAIFLPPFTTRLRIDLSTTIGFQEIYTPELPLNALTSVRIEAVGRDVFVLYNNSLVALMTTKGDRIAAENATLLVSNPWHPPASATISAVKMTIITALSFRPDINGVLSSGSAYEKTFVPKDFALSFNFTLLNPNFGDPQSIFQYSDGNPRNILSIVSSKDRIIFAISLKPNPQTPQTTTVFVNSLRLSIGKVNRIRLESVGQYSIVFLNDTLSSMIPNSFARVDENATALKYFPPWRPSASAKISNIQMSSLNIIPPKNPDLAVKEENEKVIFNSLFDDCSRDAGADAGCGRNLQCNIFSDGKTSCGPAPRYKSLFRLLDRDEGNNTDSIVVSTRHQTCGKSSRYNNICAQNTLYGRLTCSEVNSTVNGKNSKKWICLEDFGMDFQKIDSCLGASCASSSNTPTPTATVAEKDKRGVRLMSQPFATNFCYSGCGGAKII